MTTHWGSKRSLLVGCVLALSAYGCGDGKDDPPVTDSGTDSSVPSDGGSDASDAGLDASDGSVQQPARPIVRLAHFGVGAGTTTQLGDPLQTDLIHACLENTNPLPGGGTIVTNTLLTVNQQTGAASPIPVGTISSYFTFPLAPGLIRLYRAEDVTGTFNGFTTDCVPQNTPTPIDSFDMVTANLVNGDRYTLALLGHGGAAQCISTADGMPTDCSSLTEASATNPPAAPVLVAIPDADPTDTIADGKAQVRVVQTAAFYPFLQVCAGYGTAGHAPLLGANSYVPRRTVTAPYAEIDPVAATLFSTHNLAAPDQGDCAAGVGVEFAPTGSVPTQPPLSTAYSGTGAVAKAAEAIAAGGSYSVFVFQQPTEIPPSSGNYVQVPVVVVIEDVPAPAAQQ